MDNNSRCAEKSVLKPRSDRPARKTARENYLPVNIYYAFVQAETIS
jgi:hypothetical protein